MEQKKPSMLADGVRWFDDWFAIEDIAPGVYAIGEPRFHQINWNYLIEGQDTVLLFDTGPGVRDISQVVRALTDFPLITLPSHLHFDHTGNLQRFQNIALADLPVLRSCMRDGLLHASDDLFRGFLVTLELSVHERECAMRLGEHWIEGQGRQECPLGPDVVGAIL